MLISYGIENIRRIKSMDPVEIRPLTILVGRNSAGKSTFLRVLPLIRQSIETRSSAPILWYGDFVDFGDFETAVSSRDDSEKEAVFTFKINELEGDFRSESFYYSGVFFPRGEKITANSVVCKYTLKAKNNKTYLKKLSISLPDENIDMQIDFSAAAGGEAMIVVNGRRSSVLAKGLELFPVGTHLFAAPIFVVRRRDAAGNRPPSVGRSLPADIVFLDALRDVLRESVDARIGEGTISDEARRILSRNRINASSLAELRYRATTKAFKRIYLSMEKGSGDKLSEEIKHISDTYRAFSVAQALEGEMTQYFYGISYLAPARAASERFYRRQELEVSEIAPNGANFPMFLASLTAVQARRFSRWIEEIFGFGVEIEPSGGHISIHLRAGRRSVNVTDTGYGVSQILPVLGLMWWAGNRPSPRSALQLRGETTTRTLAIEQPELHLHPAHQAKLADVFAGVVTHDESRPRRHRINLVVETHSEALINRIGELIETGNMSERDVQIVIFSAEDDIDSPTDVRVARFNSEGVLQAWPYGFFNYR